MCQAFANYRQELVLLVDSAGLPSTITGVNHDPHIASFVSELSTQIEGELRADDMSRALYSSDASLYQMVPHAVLLPRTVDDVHAAVSLAAQQRVPILARAAGTSLAGQAVNEALVIDFSRHLDAIVEINSQERWVRVQPGVVLDNLNLALRPHGLQFGPDPASSSRACLGGIVASNATGSHSIRYGMTADHVLAMDVILSDGRTERFGPGLKRTAVGREIAALVSDSANAAAIRAGTPRHWRRCGGYNLDRMQPEVGMPNLARLICGSEGTLGVMTEITLNLVPTPTHTGLALVLFDDAMTALSAVPALLETEPSAIELLDHLSMSLCREVPQYNRLLEAFMDGAPSCSCILVTEYSGESEAHVRDQMERLSRFVSGAGLGATAVVAANTPQKQSAVWGVRKAGLGLLMSMRGRYKPVPFIEDAAVPVADLPAYVSQLEAFCAELGTPMTYYAHASAGCLHIRPLMDVNDATERAKMIAIAQFAADLIHGYGGALSSEHGDGRSRSWLNEAFYGPALYRLFGKVKQIFDPHNLLNPGVIVAPQAMTSNMRLPAEGSDEPRVSYDDYMDAPETISLADLVPAGNPVPGDTGLARAINLCNGAGVCRQTQSGTMCPSFMVTRDEMHSTRGRANALRAAMSGLLPVETLISRRMYEVMDLCISCKACQAECPSAVDMARLKLEFLARYHEVHGVSKRERFFGHAARLNAIGSGRLAPVANAALRGGPVRSALNRTLGLAPQRQLPQLAEQTFESWFKHRDIRVVGIYVGMLVDPFTNYNYPAVGQAAVEFLEASGYVVNPVVVDDGRAFLSKGMLAEARRAAETTLDAVLPLVEKGLPIVGLEPSSLLTLRDEYLYLLGDDARAKRVAAVASTFEEFVASEAAAGRLAAIFRPDARRLLLHGHCHQKALVGTGPAKSALSLPPGYVVEEVDSGCCGMAGSFGYKAEHYELSMAMAERRLLPAVRATDADTIVVAAGVSCRQQIAHGSGRIALHPAQVLRDALRRG